MKTFSWKVKEAIFYAQHGRCKICTEPIHSLHHRLPNTKHNRKNFPLFIQSIFNAAGLCFDCHTNRSHELKITPGEATAYEQWLREVIG